LTSHRYGDKIIIIFFPKGATPWNLAQAAIYRIEVDSASVGGSVLYNGMFAFYSIFIVRRRKQRGRAF
jgi:hypothetical protein